MTETYVKIVTDAGDEVLMAAPLTSMEEEVGFGDTVTIKAAELARSVRPVLESIRAGLVALQPDELELKATIAVAVEGGVALSLIASANVDFGIEVTMKWQSKA